MRNAFCIFNKLGVLFIHTNSSYVDLFCIYFLFFSFNVKFCVERMVYTYLITFFILSVYARFANRKMLFSLKEIFLYNLEILHCNMFFLYLAQSQKKMENCFFVVINDSTLLTRFIYFFKEIKKYLNYSIACTS